jgi:antirestriction protein ArdC
MSHTSSSAERADVYTRITAEIVAAIEVGAGEWRMPWHHNGTATTRPQNISSDKRYRGVNVLALWIAAEAHGYANGLWGTYRQWLAVDAQVRKGERGTTVVLWKQTGTGDDAEDADNDSRRRFFARAFTVFNVAQVDGYEPEPVARLPETSRLCRQAAGDQSSHPRRGVHRCTEDPDRHRQLQRTLSHRHRYDLHAGIRGIHKPRGSRRHISA